MSDEPIPMEGVRPDQIKVGDTVLLWGQPLKILSIKAESGLIHTEYKDSDGEIHSVRFGLEGRVARILPEPVEVLEFWRVTRTDPAGEEWIDDLIDRESAVREAREYLKAWKDRPGHTATVAFVRETVMSPEEVKL